MQAGENLPLQILFWHICRMLALAITPIYAFEGDNKPALKRGQKVKTMPHALTRAFQELITRAGFHYYTAPGEAEAELAQLSRENKIDAVMTEDVDALAFGATHVIRIPNTAQDGDHVSIYSSTALQRHPSVSLRAPQMILIAVLSGGDYNAEGLKGCGINVAFNLSVKSSLADDLYQAAHDMSDAKLLDFLIRWRVQLRQQLAFDPEGFLGRKHPSIARNVKCGFPKLSVLRSYVQPITSWSDGYVTPDISQWGLHKPDLALLGGWAEKYFSWGTSGTLESCFRKNVWQGICIRHLLQRPNVTLELLEHASGCVTTGDFASSNILGILEACSGPGPLWEHANVPGYTITIETHTLAVNTFRLLHPEISHPDLVSGRRTAIIWVPALILRHALPSLVSNFEKKPSKSRRSGVPGENTQPALQPLFPLVPTARATALLKAVDHISVSFQAENLRRDTDFKTAEQVARASAENNGFRFLGYVDLTDA